MHIRAAEIAELNDPNFAECGLVMIGLWRDQKRGCMLVDGAVECGGRAGFHRDTLRRHRPSAGKRPADDCAALRQTVVVDENRNSLSGRIGALPSPPPPPPRRIRGRLKLHRAGIARANMPNFRQTPSAYTLGKERDGVPSVLRGVA